MSDVVWTVGGFDLTWAWLVTIVVLAVAWTTDEVGGYERAPDRSVPVAT